MFELSSSDIEESRFNCATRESSYGTSATDPPGPQPWRREVDKRTNFWGNESALRINELHGHGGRRISLQDGHKAPFSHLSCQHVGQCDGNSVTSLSGIDCGGCMYAEVNHEYPVKEGVPRSELVQSWGSFKPDPISLNEIAALRKAASELVDKVGFDEGPSS